MTTDQLLAELEAMLAARRERKMSDYKVVPVEPTQEMIEAAQDAYMPFGDMVIALRMALLAAPAVQGEPVGTVAVMPNGSHAWIDLRTQWLPVGRHKLYAAPQPAEQKPTPDVSALEEALESIMGYIPLDVVHCRGDKCRELWCASCFGDEEAESYLVTAARHLKNTKSALAAHRKQEST